MGTPIRTTGEGIRHDGWFAITGATAVVAVIAAVFAAGFSVRAVHATPGDTTSMASAPPQTVQVEVGDLYVKPSSVEVPAGTDLTVEVTNKGQMAHDLKLNGSKGVDLVSPGTTAKAKLGTITKESQAWCTVPGHKEAGMVFTIKVTGAAAGGTAEAVNAKPVAASSAAIDPSAKPGPEFKPYDPALQPAPGGREHAVTLHATEKVLEVAPGVTQEMWTFNDQVPGPVLRGHVGDIFTVTLVNGGKMGHSIDFHASKVAPNVAMRTIQPGESLVYQFEATRSGMWMYHCGTAPALHHIGNGMYGAVIIDPPGLPPVAHEYAFVQSELYLGAQGQPGDLAKMQSQSSDAVVFNGYVNQYQHHPIRVEPNERVRVWVLDAGPNENSAFHIVGTIFDTVFKEGAYLLRPDSGTGTGGSQALDLQPSQGGFVEFTFDQPGLYTAVTHKFANVGKGAVGVFQAGDVPAAASGH